MFYSLDTFSLFSLPARISSLPPPVAAAQTFRHSQRALSLLRVQKVFLLQQREAATLCQGLTQEIKVGISANTNAPGFFLNHWSRFSFYSSSLSLQPKLFKLKSDRKWSLLKISTRSFFFSLRNYTIWRQKREILHYITTLYLLIIRWMYFLLVLIAL